LAQPEDVAVKTDRLLKFVRRDLHGDIVARLEASFLL
jgi:hypothetical protein